jgi:hypothetical protein
MNRPTYGGELGAAAQALAATRAALRAPDALHVDDVYPLAIARGQLYQALHRHAALIGGPVRNPLADVLKAAANRTTAVHRRVIQPPHLPPAESAAARALQRAADHVRIAGDVLGTHVGPDRTPRTPDGIAVLAGVGRTDNLSTIARLTTAVIPINQHLHGWLRRHRVDALTDPTAVSVIAATNATAAPPFRLPAIAASVSAHEPAGPRFLDTVTTAPDLTAPTTTGRVHDAAGFTDALDAGRAWLAQHHTDNLTGQDLRRILGTGLALTHELGRLLTLTNPATGADGIDERIARAAKQWRVAYFNTEAVVTPGRDQPSPGAAALSAAERWLRRELRDGSAWRSDTAADHPATGARWAGIARALAERLPDISEMAHRGARHAAVRGDLYTVAGLHRPAGLVHIPHWVAAGPDTPPITRLLSATMNLRPEAVSVADAAGVTPRPGVHEAQSRGWAFRSTRPRIDPAPVGDTITSGMNGPRAVAAAGPSQAASEPATADVTTASRAVDALARALRDSERDGTTITALPAAAAQDLLATIRHLTSDVHRLRDTIATNRQTDRPAPASSGPAEPSPDAEINAVPESFPAESQPVSQDVDLG